MLMEEQRRKRPGFRLEYFIELVDIEVANGQGEKKGSCGEDCRRSPDHAQPKVLPDGFHADLSIRCSSRSRGVF